jgi:hypothetical protein
VFSLPSPPCSPLCPLPLPPVPNKCWSLYCHHGFPFCRLSYSWKHAICSSIRLPSFTWQNMWLSFLQIFFRFCFLCFVLVFAILGFELRALHLLDRHHTTQATPPAPFVFSCGAGSNLGPWTCLSTCCTTELYPSPFHIFSWCDNPLLFSGA